MNTQTMKWIPGVGLGLVLAACGGTTSEPSAPGGGPGTDTAAGYLYVGACTPSVCSGLPVPEIGCATGEPEYVCSARPSGDCAVDVRCPADASDPDGAVSFAPCEDVECGPKPGTPAEACPAGYEWGGSTCGKLNDRACAWANGCYVKGEPIEVDQSKIGKACGIDVSCEAPAGCVTLPPETNVQGAHCIVDPCAAISCPSNRCVVLESYPGQVRCD